MSKPCQPTSPELLALLERAAKHVMTPAERRAQTISWVYGNLALEGSKVTREDVERHYDEMYGPTPGAASEAVE